LTHFRRWSRNDAVDLKKCAVSYGVEIAKRPHTNDLAA
jgi:hypothetical protein